MLKLQLHIHTCFSEEKKLEFDDSDNNGRILLSYCFFPFVWLLVALLSISISMREGKHFLVQLEFKFNVASKA